MAWDLGRRARWAAAASLAALLAVAIAATAQAAPTYDFTATPSPARVGAPVTFSMTVTGDVPDRQSFVWDFGGGTPTGTGTQVTYATPGTKTITLSLVDANRHVVSSVTHDLTVLALPVAAFTQSPEVPTPGQGVHFDASTSSSSDPSDPSLTYSWNFGDGTPIAHGATPDHAFATSGDTSVTLTVTASDSSTATSMRVVHVNEPPQATLGVAVAVPNTGQDSSIPTVGQAVVLNSAGSADPDGSIVSYAWDLGDGRFSAPTTTPFLVTSFSSAGHRTVRLRVTDDHGTTAIATQGVTVDAPPSAGFTISPAAPHTGDRVTFTSTASDPDGPGDVASISWDLNGDSAFTDDSGPTASAVFLTAGDYTISQRVTDRNGATATAFRTVAVTGPATPAPSPGTTPGGSTLVPAPGQPTVPPGTPAPRTGTSPVTPTSPRVLRRVRIRLAGTITGNRTTFTRVFVLAPKGTALVVRCSGKGCPRTALHRHVLRGRRGVRIPQLERTFMAGTRITVVATKHGYLPKRIRLTTRSGRPPERVEQCLMPGRRTGTTRPAPCPA